MLLVSISGTAVVVEWWEENDKNLPTIRNIRIILNP
jgi:hypothetical protein